jgi:hypothetical protein
MTEINSSGDRTDTPALPEPPNVCSECWFHDCKNCTGRGPRGGECDHVKQGHWEDGDG